MELNPLEKWTFFIFMIVVMFLFQIFFEISETLTQKFKELETCFFIETYVYNEIINLIQN